MSYHSCVKLSLLAVRRMLLASGMSHNVTTVANILGHDVLSFMCKIVTACGAQSALSTCHISQLIARAYSPLYDKIKLLLEQSIQKKVSFNVDKYPQWWCVGPHLIMPVGPMHFVKRVRPTLGSTAERGSSRSITDARL